MIHSILRACAPAFALALLRPPCASAQRPDSVVVRDTTGRRAAATARLAPVEVRASIIPVAGARVGSGVPARISIVSGEQIERREPRILPDVLATQAGVSLYDDLGSPFKLNIASRGFNVGPTVGLPAGLSVFLDGVRQNEPDAQEVNFELLPMEHVERVELLSGTASLLGANSLGGAINLVTERGVGPLSGELELTGGSYGTVSGSARASGGDAAGWRYYASAAGEREDGWRDATEARTGSAFLNAGRSSGDGARGISLQLLGTRSRSRTAGSLPESIFDASPRTNFTAGDQDDLGASQLALSAYLPLADGRFSANGYLRRSTAERFNVNQAPDPDVRGFTRNVTIGGSADWRWQPYQGRLALRAGVDAAANRVRVRIFAEPTAESGTRELTTHVTSRSLDLAAYSLADLTLGRATLSLGARWDRVRVPFRDELAETPADSVNVFTSLSPRGGVSVDLGRGVSAYASVGESFRAPAILELGCADPEATCPLPFALGDDPPLDPVRARNWEIGGRALLPWAIVDVSAYRTEVRDEIFFVASDEALLSGYFTNLDRTRREGVELSAQGEWHGERLRWYANHAWTRATFQSPAQLSSMRADDDFTDSPLAGDNLVQPGDRLPLVPSRQAKGGVTLGIADGLEIGGDARWTGRQWMRGDEANQTRPLRAYTLVDGRVSLDVGAWSLSVVATNLLDTHAATFGTFNENRVSGELERFLTPATARAVRLIVRRSLGGA